MSEFDVFILGHFTLLSHHQLQTELRRGLTKSKYFYVWVVSCMSCCGAEVGGKTFLQG